MLNRNKQKEKEVGLTKSILVMVLVALLLGVELSECSSDSRKIVQASEILAKIERLEPVEYDGVIIEGDLNLSGLELPTEHVTRTEPEIYVGLAEEVKVVESPINIANSELRGIAELSNVTFLKPVNFRKTNFSKCARFSGSDFSTAASFVLSEFSEDAHFVGAEFDRDVNFDNVKFGGDAKFSLAKFNRHAYFVGTEFGRCADFVGAAFSENAWFNGAEFRQYANFLYAEFRGGGDFLRAKFTGGNADFVGVEFRSYALFSDAEFRVYANFDNAKFNRGAEFVGAEFDRGANFGEAKFGSYSNFMRAKFQEDSDFSDAEFGADAYFDQTLFVNYPGFSNLDNIYIRWKDIAGPVANEGNLKLYSQFIDHYKEIYWFDEANDCYYHYRKQLREYTPMGKFSMIIDVAAQYSYGYGVKPLYPFTWSIVVVLLVSVFFFNKDGGPTSMNIYDPSHSGWAGIKADISKLIKSINFSAKTFLSGTKFFIEAPKIPEPLKSSTIWVNRVFELERALGALLQGLIIYSIAKTIVIIP